MVTFLNNIDFKRVEKNFVYKPIKFCGIVDGNGFAIMNLVINDIAIFEQLTCDTTFQRLKIKNVTQTSQSVSSLIVGRSEFTVNYYNIEITDCSFAGPVSGALIAEAAEVNADLVTMINVQVGSSILIGISTKSNIRGFYGEVYANANCSFI